MAETRPEHFDRVLADGKVSTNVDLRRLHNHALGIDWLLKSVIPRLQWPRPLFKSKRAIITEEHAEVTVPSLDIWEKQWKKDPHEMEKPTLLAADFLSAQKSSCAGKAVG